MLAVISNQPGPDKFVYTLPDGSDDTPDENGNHTATRNVLHSTEQYARFPGCPECKSVHDFETNPPPPAPPVTVFTKDDLRDGADALLAAMRREFAKHTERLPQYNGYADDCALAIVTKRIGGGRTYVRAEVGDAVLVKTTDRSDSPELAGTVTAWCPRVESWVATQPAGLRVVAK